MQTALLRIDSLETALTVGSDVRLRVPVGWEQLARRHLWHTPPQPVELEKAIDDIEEAIAAARGDPGGPCLVVARDATLQEIAAAAGATGSSPTLDRAAVERLFNRLAEVAEGSPARDLPLTPAFVATLLILRELMHHLAIESLEVGDWRQ